MTFHLAGPAADLAPGAVKSFAVNGKTVAIVNVHGAYYAVDNACAHRGGPLGEGVLDGEVLVCPWHGWPYDVKSGQCQTNPNARVKGYPVKVEGGQLHVGFE